MIFCAVFQYFSVSLQKGVFCLCLSNGLNNTLVLVAWKHEPCHRFPCDLQCVSDPRDALARLNASSLRSIAHRAGAHVLRLTKQLAPKTRQPHPQPHSGSRLRHSAYLIQKYLRCKPSILAVCTNIVVVYPKIIYFQSKFVWLSHVIRKIRDQDFRVFFDHQVKCVGLNHVI